MARSRSPKRRRIEQLLREIIAEEVAELKDPRLGFVTVTAVETSPDLRKANVYYSVLGDEEQQRSTEEGLRSAAPRLRSRVGARVRLRHTPELDFLIDESVEGGLRISQLLSGLDVDDRHDPEADSTQGSSE
jgi:ribosome-binding factor A